MKSRLSRKTSIITSGVTLIGIPSVVETRPCYNTNIEMLTLRKNDFGDMPKYISCNAGM